MAKHAAGAFTLAFTGNARRRGVRFGEQQERLSGSEAGRRPWRYARNRPADAIGLGIRDQTHGGNGMDRRCRSEQCDGPTANGQEVDPQDSEPAE